MDKRTIILLVVLFGLIVLGMFVFAFLKKGEIEQLPPAAPVETPMELPYAMVDRIEAKHYFDGTTHTFVGEIVLPTPCDLLEVNSAVLESYPEQVKLEFSVINNAEVCAQVLTAQRFKVSAIASKAAEVSATFMGRVVTINLIPALPGETPEEFELFIKG